MTFAISSTESGTDQRGWILTACSSLACMIGASVVLIDLMKWPNINIRESSTFLASALTLSFSVLCFSAARLFSKSIDFYAQDGWSGDKAWYLTYASYSCGFLLCFYLSKFLHRFIPHEVVKCGDRENKDSIGDNDDTASRFQEEGRIERNEQTMPNNIAKNRTRRRTDSDSTEEQSPLLKRPACLARPSIKERFASSLSIMLAKNRKCDTDGPCYGALGDTCGTDCIRRKDDKTNQIGQHCNDNDKKCSSRLITRIEGSSNTREEYRRSSYGSHSSDAIDNTYSSTQNNQTHHHHVPSKYMGIGIQTSVALAIHRLPEGFLGFATNHANPNLGLTVFISLWAHNLMEGFTMCLPMYLALRSIWKALLFTFVLGGLTQPLGALVAFIWLKTATSPPNDTIYAILFSATAGVVSVVAIQLLRQIPNENNNSIIFVSFLMGIGIMTISTGLTESSSI